MKVHMKSNSDRTQQQVQLTSLYTADMAELYSTPSDAVCPSLYENYYASGNVFGKLRMEDV